MLTNQTCEVSHGGASAAAHRIHARQTTLCEAAALLVEPVALVARRSIKIIDAVVDNCIERWIRPNCTVLEIINLEQVTEVSAAAPVHIGGAK